ncbi:MAG TPA: hypothetical protein DCL78_10125, partial [Gammaproteobacteria bacterium]|nr:hypothetical protein [Gammaproteobacteria bacterium]
MLDLNYITQPQYDAAVAELETAELHGIPVQVEAPYFAEMVRRDMVALYGDKADTDGYRVYTTLKADFQTSANAATQKGLVDYDRRHGYRGEEAKLDYPLEEVPLTDLVAELKRFRTIGPLQPALITEVSDESAKALLKSGETVSLTLEGMQWARRYIDNVDRGPEPKKVSDVVEVGQIVRIIQEKDEWTLAQKPQAQSGMVSFNPNNGALLALVGGFDFQSSKFNRAVQGGRQAGSSFKPFIYSAALDKGMTPATVINDAPVVFEDSSLESTWR